MATITGNHDGSSAVDYTVNPATGFPWATGPRNLGVPFNHLLPAWDAITGTLVAAGVLAAERHRSRTGEGQALTVALSDVAFAMVGNLGKIAEAQLCRRERQKEGNYLYGAFGRDFLTKDGRRVMVVALTPHQWKALVDATGLHAAFELVERQMDVDLSKEGDRFAAREVLGAILKPWTVLHTLEEIGEIFDRHGVCWGPYQTFLELVDQDPRCSTENPMFDEVEQPGIGTYLMAGSPLLFSEHGRLPATQGAGPRRAHRRDPRRVPCAERRRDRAASRRRGGRRADRGRRLTAQRRPGLSSSGLAFRRGSARLGRGSSNREDLS